MVIFFIKNKSYINLNVKNYQYILKKSYHKNNKVVITIKKTI